MNRHCAFGVKLSVAVLCAGAVTAENTTDPVDLRLKWEVGKRYVMRVENSQEMAITVMPGAEPMKQSGRHSFTLAVAVPRALPEGGRELEMTYLDAAFSMNMGGRSVSFDSRSQEPAGADNPLAAVSKMVGARITCRLDSEGRIQTVEGLKEFSARMTEDNPQVAQMLEGFLNAESFKRSFGGYFGLHWLPRRAVKLGENWTVEDEVPVGALGTFVSRIDYKFEEWKNDQAVLTCSGSLSSRPADPIEQGGVTIGITIENGRIGGRTLFDPQRGAITSSTLETAADLRVTVKGPDGVTRNMDQKLNQKYSAELVRVEDLEQPADD